MPIVNCMPSFQLIALWEWPYWRGYICFSLSSCGTFEKKVPYTEFGGNIVLLSASHFISLRIWTFVLLVVLYLFSLSEKRSSLQRNILYRPWKSVICVIYYVYLEVRFFCVCVLQVWKGVKTWAEVVIKTGKVGGLCFNLNISY